VRETWDDIARLGSDAWIGGDTHAQRETDDLFGRLGSERAGGVCVEVGCGFGRMTVELARRFDHVIAVDVSPEMLDRARERAAAAGAANVEFRLTDGADLAVVASRSADVAVCYLVLQHLPSRALVARYIAELGRALKPGGEALLQLPVLRGGFVPRAWRGLRSLLVPASAALARHPSGRQAFRGVRLTARELREAITAAGLRVAAAQTAAASDYRFSREVFLRLGA
jgi:SAM-dependent methyltransferase